MLAVCECIEQQMAVETNMFTTTIAYIFTFMFISLSFSLTQKIFYFYSTSTNFYFTCSHQKWKFSSRSLRIFVVFRFVYYAPMRWIPASRLMVHTLYLKHERHNNLKCLQLDVFGSTLLREIFGQFDLFCFCVRSIYTTYVELISRNGSGLNRFCFECIWTSVLHFH